MFTSFIFFFLFAISLLLQQKALNHWTSLPQRVRYQIVIIILFPGQHCCVFSLKMWLEEYFQNLTLLDVRNTLQAKGLGYNASIQDSRIVDLYVLCASFLSTEVINRQGCHFLLASWCLAVLIMSAPLFALVFQYLVFRLCLPGMCFKKEKIVSYNYWDLNKTKKQKRKWTNSHSYLASHDRSYSLKLGTIRAWIYWGEEQVFFSQISSAFSHNL